MSVLSESMKDKDLRIDEMKASLRVTLFISTEINVYTHTGSRTSRTGKGKNFFFFSHVFGRISYLDFHYNTHMEILFNLKSTRNS